MKKEEGNTIRNKGIGFKPLKQTSLGVHLSSSFSLKDTKKKKPDIQEKSSRKFNTDAFGIECFFFFQPFLLLSLL